MDAKYNWWGMKNLCDDYSFLVESWKICACLHDSPEIKVIFDKCKNVVAGGGKGNSKGKPH